MLDNHVYNLMLQLVQEHKSLWRIKNHYQGEIDTEEEKTFWDKMQKDKEEHIEELLSLIKNHLN